MTYCIRATLTDLVNLFVNPFLSSKFHFLYNHYHFPRTTSSQQSNPTMRLLPKANTSYNTDVTPNTKHVQRDPSLRSLAKEDEKEEALLNVPATFTHIRLRPKRHHCSPRRSLRHQRTSRPILSTVAREELYTSLRACRLWNTVARSTKIHAMSPIPLHTDTVHA